MQINLNTPRKIVIQEERSKNIETLTVVRVVDLPQQKMVRCFLDEIDEPVVLWEGEAYDTIGQWTDSDVTERLSEIFNAE